MSIEEKLEAVTDAVYDKGHTDGYAEWEQVFMNSQVFSYLFSSGDKKELREKWKAEYTSKGTDFEGMFRNCMGGMATAPALDTSKGKKFSNMFTNCTKTETIPKINITNATTVASMFSGCGSLKNIEFDGEIAITLTLSTCPLTTTSMKNIIQHLVNLYDRGQNESYSIILKSTCWDTLEADSKPYQEEWTNVTDETMTWQNYVTMVLGWNT
jgi:hypothetical protein